MTLYRLRLEPLSPWLTPWQADTLAGMLCWACARTEGSDVLRQEILDPARRGEPTFVLSDAFPGDLLPLPLALRLQDFPDQPHKKMKQARWLGAQAFQRCQQGARLAASDLLPEESLGYHTQVRNTLSRTSDMTGATDSLFARTETALKSQPLGAQANAFLSVYTRIASGFEERFMSLFDELAKVGFGEDATVGKGQFSILSPGLEPAGWLDEAGAGGDVAVSLSTFQPGPQDPTDGLWESFIKYGKLGPDFGLKNVFKRPLVMFRPGACLRQVGGRPIIGRAIPMDQVLSIEVCQDLRSRGTDVLHLAYGLAVPARLTLEG